MFLDRRELCLLLPSALLGAAVPLEAAAPQDASLPSATFTFDSLPMHTLNGAEIRSVLKGKLATGEPLETHETTLPPGVAPHPPHRHPHSEMWLIREGTVEVTINGKSHILGPGSVGFVQSNEEHGIRNAGAVRASYFVVGVGPGADK
ncbi:MAG TPA: cupin domain-containing protein [Candidatus Acidoferrales bacterium]|nr:cupin domain-containing protein [Candidatus Acidoferrales bacterium]